MFVDAEDLFKERTRIGENDLVRICLPPIIADQGHIGKLFVILEALESVGCIILVIIPCKTEFFRHLGFLSK